jgi:hypothetical protein
MSTTFPIDVTVDRLVEFAGTIDAICLQEIGRRPTHTPGDPVGEILQLMALHGRTGEELVAWLHEQPEAVAFRTKPRRPAAVRHAPLPPFDVEDPGGRVHTVFPPDLVIPSAPDRDFWRGDIGGVMLAEAPPFVDGANTTPAEMTMSYLLPKYVQFGTAQIDAFLTAHAQRGYTHFHFDLWQADAAGIGDAQFLDLIEYVQSWGFYTSAWLASSAYDRRGGWASVGPRVTAFLDALLARPQQTLDRFIALPGGELNNACSPEGSDAIIANVAARCNPVGIPVWLHFTANYPGYPSQALVAKRGDNIDTALVEWWQQWVGKVKGLCWQGDQNHPAGLMGAKMWDARRILGWADPSLRLVAFELLATNQLYGRATEEDGCLRGYEMLCCPNAPGYHNPAVSGFGNGGRLPDGSAI